MALCPSGLMISAIVCIIILHDIFSNKSGYIIDHAILGGILCVLFFTMCNYGLEIINWVFLSFIPIYLILSWSFAASAAAIESLEDSEECEQCQQSQQCEQCKQSQQSQQAAGSACPIPPRKPACSPPTPVKASCPVKAEANVASSRTKSISDSKLSCPASPISLSTACGISRFS